MATEVVVVDDDESGLEWTYSWMECAICGYVYVAVYPTVAPRLECTCGYMNERPDPPDQEPREADESEKWKDGQTHN